MIDLWVSSGEGTEERNLGRHRFAVLPRLGEGVKLYVDGEITGGIVDAVFHGTRPLEGSGPEGEPFIGVRLKLG